MKGNYLVTTNDWFYAPNGMKYKAAWGNVEVLSDDVLGVKTNRQSTNWFIRVGDDVNGIIIAGCQVYYSVSCEEQPNIEDVTETGYDGKDSHTHTRNCEIYIAQ